jgi:hypothetical protein
MKLAGAGSWHASLPVAHLLFRLAPTLFALTEVAGGFLLDGSGDDRLPTIAGLYLGGNCVRGGTAGRAGVCRPGISAVSKLPPVSSRGRRTPPCTASGRGLRTSDVSCGSRGFAEVATAAARQSRAACLSVADIHGHFTRMRYERKHEGEKTGQSQTGDSRCHAASPDYCTD